MVLLARDEGGYANLCRLLTDAHMLGERGDPHLAVEQICAHAHGLAAVLGPRSGAGRLAVAGRLGAARRAIDPWREAFGDRCHVAVEHRLERDSSREVRRMLALADASAPAPSPRTPFATSSARTRSSPTRSSACGRSCRSRSTTSRARTPKDG